MERHGEEPKIVGFTSQAEEVDGIRKLITDFRASGNQSLGIICKTHQQASWIHSQLRVADVHLLTADSTAFVQGIAITTVHMGEGS
ncbi:MAG: hypothetical protein WDO15_26640 [Bacteroidota bacterium]